jgi:putative membrane-bound dehydrogenase-like protein
MPRCLSSRQSLVWQQRGLLVAMMIAVAAGMPAASAELTAGTALMEITPPPGGAIVGGFLPVPVQGVHDPLHARCLVLDDGTTRVALVVCDLLGIHRAVSDEARRRIAARSGIAPGAVLIAATHTHSATSALGDRIAAAGPLDAYQEQVAEAIAMAVARAAGEMVPVAVGHGAIEAPEHLFNRRWFLRPGTVPANPFGGTDMVKMNPAPGSPDLVEPAGPTDPTLSFILVRGLDGSPVAVFAAYGLHYVGGTGPGEISADYFAEFATDLARRTAVGGRGPLVMLANGASGDVNNIDFRQPRPPAAPHERIRAVAHDLAARVAAALPKVDCATDVRLGHRFREVAVGHRVPSAADLEWARRTLAAEPPPAGRADLPRIYADRVLRLENHPATIDVPAQVLAIGPALIGTLPCEVFAELGLEFSRRAPQRPAFLVSLAHGYYGYLPAARHHRLGGYETWLGTNRLEATAGTTLVDALVAMADDVAREPPAPEVVRRASRLPEPLVMEAAATEPAVVDPVAITFDEKGRPFVVEYRDYPTGPPGGGPPLSRIVRLDDADGDGLYESSTLFADGLAFAQGVLAIRGGLLVTAAPDLLFLADDDGDGRADRREVVATGFKEGNPQLRAACPTLGIDNAVWITGGLSGGRIRRPGAAEETAVAIDRRDLRYDPARGTLAAASGFGQFGNTRDDVGRRYNASNRNPLMAVLLPAAALDRNPLVDVGPGTEDAAPAGADSRVHPIVATRSTALSHAGTHTSACGLTIFRGDLLGPAAVGDAFTCEPVGHLVTRRRLLPAGAGFTSRRVEPDGVDFLASEATFFRPVFTATGPDGALWVVDMCRGSVEHPDYMPPGVAATVDHRAGDGAGRIWRIRDPALAPRPWVPPADAAAAVTLLADPNGWRRDTAQRLLVQGHFAGAVAELERLVAVIDEAPATIHALWALEGLGALEPRHVARAAASSHAPVRETAARLAAEAVGWRDPAIDRGALVATVAARLVEDPDAHVRLAAILLAAGVDSPATTTALATAAVRGDIDRIGARALVSGAAGRALPLLEGLAAASPSLPATVERCWLVEALATTVTGTPPQQEGLQALLAAPGERAAWFDVAALAGLVRRVPLPGPAERARVAGALDRAAGLAADPSAPLHLRQTAIRALAAAASRPAAPAGPDADQAGKPDAGPDEPSARVRQCLAGLGAGHQPPDVQRTALVALAGCGDTAAIDAVIAALPEREPAVRAAALAAVTDRRDAAARLVAAIDAGRVPAALVPLDRRALLAKSPDETLRAAAQRIWPPVAPGDTAARIGELSGLAAHGGDLDRGRDVFARHCAACHRSAGLGHSVGPDLAEAADRPLERLVTDIVDPNRSVEPRFEAAVVVTTDGEVVDGVLVESGAEAVVLARAGGERRVVPRSAIDTLSATGRSLMPEGFGRTIPAVEFVDLIEFLRDGRPVPRTP